MRTFPKRSDGQDETDMNIYTAAGPLPDGDTRISFAARLRYNSRCHGAAGIPLGSASIAGIIEETIADEIPFTDEETADLLADLIEPSACENENGPSSGHFTCSACGADAPLGKVRLPDGNYEGGWRIESINNCPYCGRRVVIPKRSPLEVIQGGSKAPRD